MFSIWQSDVRSRGKWSCADDCRISHDAGGGPLHATGTNPRFADDIIRWSWTNEMFVRGCKRAAPHDKKTSDDGSPLRKERDWFQWTSILHFLTANSKQRTKKAASSRRMKLLIKPNRNYPLRTRRRCAMNAPPTAVMPINAKVVGSGTIVIMYCAAGTMLWSLKAVIGNFRSMRTHSRGLENKCSHVAPVIDSVIWASK